MTSFRSPGSRRALAALVELSHHRWVIPLVAALGNGQRFAVLVSLLETNRQSLKRALEATDRLGLTEPNPGYGHPLRPEYILTPRGMAIAAQCRGVVGAADRRGWSALLARKWSLPVLTAVRMGAMRYFEIEAGLSTASPRALSKSLDQLAAAGCLDRTRSGGKPARSTYALTAASQPLARCGVSLARAASASLGSESPAISPR